MGKGLFQRSEQMFHAAVESMIDPFVVMEAVRDASGAIVDFVYAYANSAAAQVCQTPPEAMVGRRLLDTMPAHRENGLFALYCQVVETGQPLELDEFEYEDVFNGVRQRLTLDLRGTRLDDGLALTWRDMTGHKQMEAELIEVRDCLAAGIERERAEMARRLHDGPVQDLYAIDYQLHDLQSHFEPGDPEPGPENSAGEEVLNLVQGMLHQVINTVQEMVGELRPTTLAPFGLKSAILSHLHRYEERHPETQFTLNLDEDRQVLDNAARLGLFRIYQKLIDNVERYAQASQVNIGLRIHDHTVELAIEDNGVGFVLPERQVMLVRCGQYGLVGSAAQAERLGGRLEADSAPGRGTRIRVIIPIEEEKSPEN